MSERVTEDQVIYDRTPAACGRCKGTRRVGFMFRAAPLFDKMVGKPMSVTQDEARSLITRFCDDTANGGVGFFLRPALQNLGAIECPDCLRGE